MTGREIKKTQEEEGMKNIKTGTICACISMISVFIMLVWGFVAGDFSRSWLVVMAGGIASAIISMVRKDTEASRKAEETEEKQ